MCETDAEHLMDSEKSMKSASRANRPVDPWAHDSTAGRGTKSTMDPRETRLCSMYGTLMNSQILVANLVRTEMFTQPVVAPALVGVMTVCQACVKLVVTPALPSFRSCPSSSSLELVSRPRVG